jgi:hypothetical protein
LSGKVFEEAGRLLIGEHPLDLRLEVVAQLPRGSKAAKLVIRDA